MHASTQFDATQPKETLKEEVRMCAENDVLPSIAPSDTPFGKLSGSSVAIEVSGNPKTEKARGELPLMRPIGPSVQNVPVMVKPELPFATAGRKNPSKEEQMLTLGPGPVDSVLTAIDEDQLSVASSNLSLNDGEVAMTDARDMFIALFTFDPQGARLDPQGRDGFLGH